MAAIALMTSQSLKAEIDVFFWPHFNLTPADVNSSVTETTFGGNATVISQSTIAMGAYTGSGIRSVNIEEGTLQTRVNFDDFFATDVSFSITGLQAPGLAFEVEMFDNSGSALITNITSDDNYPALSGVATSGTTATWNFDENLLSFVGGATQALNLSATGDVRSILITAKPDATHNSGRFHSTDDFGYTTIRAESATTVPEPSSTLLLCLGSLGLLLRRNK